MSKFDGVIRRFIPSMVVVSKHPVFAPALDLIDKLIPMPFPELRNLPPNRFRLRIGIENSLFFNHIKYRYRACNIWLYAFASGFCKLDSNIVDLGCGCGRSTIVLQEYSFLGESKFKGHYIGIDVDQEMIDWCKTRFPDDRFAFLTVDVYNKIYNKEGNEEIAIFKLPIEDDSQDFVIAMSLFTHLLEKDLIKYFEECFRLMRKGAYLIGTVFCIDDLQESKAFQGRWTFKHKLENAFIENQQFPEAAVAYTRNYLIEKCKNIGFETVEITDNAKKGSHPNGLLICKK